MKRIQAILIFTVALIGAEVRGATEQGCINAGGTVTNGKCCRITKVNTGRRVCVPIDKIAPRTSKPSAPKKGVKGVFGDLTDPGLPGAGGGAAVGDSSKPPAPKKGVYEYDDPKLPKGSSKPSEATEEIPLPSVEASLDAAAGDASVQCAEAYRLIKEAVAHALSAGKEPLCTLPKLTVASGFSTREEPGMKCFPVDAGYDENIRSSVLDALFEFITPSYTPTGPLGNCLQSSSLPPACFHAKSAFLAPKAAGDAVIASGTFTAATAYDPDNEWNQESSLLYDRHLFFTGPIPFYLFGRTVPKHKEGSRALLGYTCGSKLITNMVMLCVSDDIGKFEGNCRSP